MNSPLQPGDILEISAGQLGQQKKIWIVLIPLFVDGTKNNEQSILEQVERNLLNKIQNLRVDHVCLDEMIN